MNRRGVTYDTGMVFSGKGGGGIPTRPKLDIATAERELQIARDDLHCNAVRLIGRDVDRLVQVAERALTLGLEVWLSPALWGGPADETLRYDVSAAERAERLRQRHPDRLVLVLGSELTIFMHGIVPGRDFGARTREAFTRVKAGDHSASDRLNDFLGRATAAVRRVYHGPLTYASLIWEDVDWDRFDLIGVDHYRDTRIKDRYTEMLQPLLATGKPVINTEFGMRTYRGAESEGTLGFGVADVKRIVLHQILPFVRERLNGDYIRDEAMQARELIETLTALDAAGVDGAFVHEFVTARATFSEQPRYDLDMNAFALVKTYRHGRGTTYPDMNWEPKQSFHAVAGYYASLCRSNIELCDLSWGHAAWRYLLFPPMTTGCNPSWANLVRTGSRGDAAAVGEPARAAGRSRKNGPVIYRFAVGRLSCAVISDGQMTPPWEPPLAAFFTPAAGVPGHELHAALAAEGRHKSTVSCGYNCLLVQTSNGHAVIDTGLGARFLGYGPRIEPLVGKLGDGLAAAGAPAADLAAVVFTHLHQDHCRGATWPGELTFPRATGFAHAAEVAFWSGAEAASGPADEHLASAREAIRLFGDRLRPFSHDAEILPGVRIVDAAGHTPGHSAVLLHSDGERLLCVGDLFYDPLQLSRPEWSTPWDHDAARAVRTRRRLLDRAAGEHLLVHAYHLPFPGLGTITRHGSAYRWQPLRHDESQHAPTPGP